MLFGVGGKIDREILRKKGDDERGYLKASDKPG